MFASGMWSVSIAESSCVLSFIHIATSLFQGVPKLSEIFKSSTGKALLRKKLFERTTRGIIEAYISIRLSERFSDSNTKNEQPKITAGGTNVIMNLSPLDGNS